MLPFSVWNLQFATGCSFSEGGALWVWRMEPGSIHWDNNVWHIYVFTVHCMTYLWRVRPLRPVCTMHCTLYLVQWISCIVHCAVCLAVHSVEDEGRVRPLRPPAQPSGPDTSAAQNLLSTQTHWNSLLCTYMIYTNTQVLIYKHKYKYKHTNKNTQIQTYLQLRPLWTQTIVPVQLQQSTEWKLMKRLMHFMNLKPKKLRLQENRRQQNSTKCIKTALGVHNVTINIKQKRVGVHQNMRVNNAAMLFKALSWVNLVGSSSEAELLVKKRGNKKAKHWDVRMHHQHIQNKTKGKHQDVYMGSQSNGKTHVV